MFKFGGWEIDVPRDKYPEKVASAIPRLNELIGFGCSYDVIAYLGHQPINGTNHAILAEQTVMNGKDTKNAVVITLNEKPGTLDVACSAVRPIVESGGPLGGTKIEMSRDIPEEAQEAFKKAAEAYTGARFDLVAYIGEKVTKGVNYIFVAEVRAVVENPVPDLAVIAVNALEHKIYAERLFEVGTEDNKDVINKLGYAFTWLK